MKKLVLILCLACFSVSAFADEVYFTKISTIFRSDTATTSQNINKNISAGNILQQDYEEKFKEQLSEQISIEILFSGIFIFRDDYNGYLNGGGSLYGEIIDKIANLENSNMPNKDITLKYLTQMKCNIENTAQNNTNIKPIIIPDNDFKILDDETKFFINLNNICSQDDKTIYLDSIIKGFNTQTAKWQDSFNKNKNNPKVLKELYDEVTTVQNRIKKYLDSKFASQIAIDNKLNEFYKNLNSTSYIIYKQGESYEKQKFLAWAQKNNKKVIANISLAAYVYQPYAPAPEIGYLYVYNPKMDFTLQAFQTVPGGVILTGSYYMVHTPEIDNIFLQTSKQYADGKYILEPIIAEYKGFYEYYTVLGTKKRIYKFYRLGESELKKNFEIPGQPFYFYQPY